MTQITIDIKKETVFSEVLKVTGYLGAKDTADASTYEQIAVSESNYEMLERFLANGETVVTDLLRGYLSSLDMSEGYKIVLDLPSNWNTALESDVKQTILNYFVNYVSAQWVRIVKDQTYQVNNHEDKWNQDAAGSLAQLRRKVNDRIRPKRSESNTSTTEENE